MSSMFWGLSMKPNRKYSQTIIKSFHISGVALDEGDTAKLYLTAEKQKYIVATVSKAIPQVQLDLNFREGDKIIFQTTGDATVSLLGYLHDIESDNSDEEYDDEEYSKMAKALKNQTAGGESDDEEDDDEEDDVDASQLSAEYSSLVDGEDSDESVEEEDDEEEEEEDDSEDEPPKAKQAKLAVNAQKQGKEQNGVVKNDKQPKNKKDKKEVASDNKKEQQKPKDVKQATGERAIVGGVKIEDVRVGNGPEAKQGKRVSVYYVGRLKSNNKTFDSMQKGAGFKFSLGAGEVIKGWDVGVVGMKVGGKRRITCPPHMAYGTRGSPPTIPGNSTLVFDVELKTVN